MARLSSIDRMPAEVRVLIGKRRRAGATIAEIREELAGLGYPLSIATVGKFTKRIDDRERATATARRAIEEHADRNEGVLGRLSALNIELVQAGVLDALGKRLAAGQDMGVSELRDIAEALRRLAEAARNDAERERALLGVAAKRAVKAASSEGLAEDAVNRIRAAIIGGNG